MGEIAGVGGAFRLMEQGRLGTAAAELNGEGWLGAHDAKSWEVRTLLAPVREGQIADVRSLFAPDAAKGMFGKRKLAKAIDERAVLLERMHGSLEGRLADPAIPSDVRAGLERVRLHAGTAIGQLRSGAPAVDATVAAVVRGHLASIDATFGASQVVRELTSDRSRATPYASAAVRGAPIEHLLQRSAASLQGRVDAAAKALDAAGAMHDPEQARGVLQDAVAMLDLVGHDRIDAHTYDLHVQVDAYRRALEDARRIAGGEAGDPADAARQLQSALRAPGKAWPQAALAELPATTMAHNAVHVEAATAELADVASALEAAAARLTSGGALDDAALATGLGSAQQVASQLAARLAEWAREEGALPAMRSAAATAEDATRKLESISLDLARGVTSPAAARQQLPAVVDGLRAAAQAGNDANPANAMRAAVADTATLLEALRSPGVTPEAAHAQLAAIRDGLARVDADRSAWNGGVAVRFSAAVEAPLVAARLAVDRALSGEAGAAATDPAVVADLATRMDTLGEAIGGATVNARNDLRTEAAWVSRFGGFGTGAIDLPDMAGRSDAVLALEGAREAYPLPTDPHGIVQARMSRVQSMLELADARLEAHQARIDAMDTSRVWKYTSPDRRVALGHVRAAEQEFARAQVDMPAAGLTVPKDTLEAIRSRLTQVHEHALGDPYQSSRGSWPEKFAQGHGALRQLRDQFRDLTVHFDGGDAGSARAQVVWAANQLGGMSPEATAALDAVDAAFAASAANGDRLATSLRAGNALFDLAMEPLSTAGVHHSAAKLRAGRDLLIESREQIVRALRASDERNDTASSGAVASAVGELDAQIMRLNGSVASPSNEALWPTLGGLGKARSALRLAEMTSGFAASGEQAAAAASKAATAGVGIPRELSPLAPDAI